MKERLNLAKVSPAAYKAMMALENYIAKSKLEKPLYELIKTRASQINGCHYCIDMHTRGAIADGEAAKRLFLLDAWRETELYTTKERAVLALTEEMTLIADHHVSDEVYNQAAQYLSENEMAAVIMAVVTINGWNRMAITTVMPLENS